MTRVRTGLVWTGGLYLLVPAVWSLVSLASSNHIELTLVALCYQSLNVAAGVSLLLRASAALWLVAAVLLWSIAATGIGFYHRPPWHDEGWVLAMVAVQFALLVGIFVVTYLLKRSGDFGGYKSS